MSRSRRPLVPSTASIYQDSKGKLGRLLHYDEIPSWQQENEYVLSGYRPTSGSVRRSLESLLYINNETVSIYSHLIGAVLFATLPFYVYHEVYARYDRAQIADIIVFSTFFFGVAICFLLSATCHIIWNHSPSYASFGNQLDYLGVIVLMWGSAIPTIYYGFHCDPHLQRIYWTMISLIALACAIVTCNPRFCHPTFRPYRAAMYTGLGFSAVVFVIHGLLLYGWETQNNRMALGRMGWMATFNVIGAATYAARVPEKWYPYTYDIYGGSHQIFHVMVIFAGLAHMVGLLEAFDYTRAQVHAC